MVFCRWVLPSAGQRDFTTGSPAFRTAAPTAALVQEDHRADYPQPAAGQVGLGGEAGDGPAREEVHQQGFGRVVLMVAERDHVAAALPGQAVQPSPPHAGAEAAGVGFLPLLEYHLPETGAADFMRDPPFPAERGNRGIVGRLPRQSRGRG